MELADAALIFRRASELIGVEEYEVEAADVLRLSKASKCSAYDCEYVALAELLDLELVTADTMLAKAFPKRSRSVPDCFLMPNVRAKRAPTAGRQAPAAENRRSTCGLGLAS